MNDMAHHMNLILRAAGALLVASSAACLAPVEVPNHKVSFHVTSDPGRPMEGASLMLDDREIAKTGPDGVATVTFRGAQGDVVRVAVKCPADHLSPVDKVAVSLRGLVDDRKLPQYDVSCPPTARSFVVAVRADNGTNLPVFYEGQEVSRTDGSGAAHVFVSAAPGQQFALTLGTDEKGAEHLRPRNPTVTFVAGDRDDILTMDEHFASDVVKKKVSVPTRVTRTDIPIRLTPR